MSDTESTEQSERLDRMIDMLTRLAGGDLEARLPVTDSRDPLDTIAAALNMLAEELTAAIDSERLLRSNLERIVGERTEELQQKLATIEEQGRTILELSTPVLRIWDEILVQPLIGAVDADRARQIVSTLLSAVVENKASVVILDVTGVPFVDSEVAHHFLKTVSAVRLLGAKVILTGVSPANALTLTRLGIETEDLRTKGSLQEGLQLAMKMVKKPER